VTDHPRVPPRAENPLVVVLLSLASLLCILRLVGCNRSDQPSSPGGKNGVTTATDASSPGSSEAAAAILKRSIAQYQQATAYRDEGHLSLNFLRNGRRTEQSWDAAVKFERPGRIRLDVYNLHLASDAKSSARQLMARVEDAESNNIDNQFVVRPAPETITLEFLASDPILFSQLTGRFQRPPVQLELLLAADPLATLFGPEVKLAQRSEASLDNRACHVIEATASEGKFVFWIDRESLIVRRLEYPAKALLPDLASDPLVTEATLVAEMTGATFAPAAAGAVEYTLSTPPGAKVVRAFVLPPVTPYSHILGTDLPAYEFSLLGGGKLNPAALNGKVTALFWYAHHPVCEEPLKHFAALAEELGEKLEAYAICTEPTDVGDKAVREQLAAWNVKLEPARDLKEYRSRVFQVRDLPAITLLDAQGRLQWLESGPAAVAALPKALQQLLSGADLAAETKAEEQLLRTQYERLVAAGGAQVDMGIAAASPASKLKIEPVWTLTDVDAPASLLMVDIDTLSPRLLVVVGGRSVWEVSTAGEILAKHQLDLPEPARVTAIRSSVDSEGKRVYAAFAPTQPGVYVFNEEWERKFVYPSVETDALQVRDVQFCPLGDNQGPQLLVAFAENTGLHAVSLDGERLWSNRAFAPLLSVAVSQEIPDRGHLIYVTGRGGIGAINRFGQEEPQRTVGDWALSHLFASAFAEATQATYLAAGVTQDSEPCLIGLDRSLKEMWNVPLSGSLFEQPVDFAASGKLRANSAGEWVVGWGDGVVTIVSENGEFDDAFGTGKAIRGIAVASEGNTPLIIVSTPNEVVARSVAE
jgi:hypothetical protein